LSRASCGGKGRGNGESLRPMDKVRELQRKLWTAAKRSRNRRFALLYDKVYRKDFLWEAWHRVRANGGAPGLDGKTIQAVEEHGVEEFLEGIQKDLKAGEYCLSGGTTSRSRMESRDRWGYRRSGTEWCRRQSSS